MQSTNSHTDRETSNKCYILETSNSKCCSSPALSAESDSQSEGLSSYSLAASSSSRAGISARSSPVGSSGSTSGAEDSLQACSTSLDSHGANDSPGPCRQSNLPSNLLPRTEKVNKLVDSVRLRFLHRIAELPAYSLAAYEECDLCELQAELPPPAEQDQSIAFRLISRYLHPAQLGDDASELRDKELNELVGKLEELLKFRRQYRLPSVKPDQFCKEFYLLNGVFLFGHDKQHLPMLYMRAGVHRRWSQRLSEALKRYVAWHINTVTKSYAGAKLDKSAGKNGTEKDGSFGICFYCRDVSYASIDMDFTRFIVRLMVNYYPTYCRYALCVDLPWLFRSVWKLARSWMPEETRNTLYLISSKQLTDFVDEQSIPISIKLDNDDTRQIEASERLKHKLPMNYDLIRSFEEFAQELRLSPSEQKAFKSHLANVVEEYKQLGAL